MLQQFEKSDQKREKSGEEREIKGRKIIGHIEEWTEFMNETSREKYSHIYTHSNYWYKESNIFLKASTSNKCL